MPKITSLEQIKSKYGPDARFPVLGETALAEAVQVLRSNGYEMVAGYEMRYPGEQVKIAIGDANITGAKRHEESIVGPYVMPDGDGRDYIPSNGVGIWHQTTPEAA